MHFVSSLRITQFYIKNNFEAVKAFAKTQLPPGPGSRSGKFMEVSLELQSKKDLKECRPKSTFLCGKKIHQS